MSTPNYFAWARVGDRGRVHLIMSSSVTVIERLADVQHSIWAHWMNYMFKCGTLNDDGTYTLPADRVQRWQRQMNTPYGELSESEKDSDREQVGKVLAVILPYE